MHNSSEASALGSSGRVRPGNARMVQSTKYDVQSHELTLRICRHQHMNPPNGNLLHGVGANSKFDPPVSIAAQVVRQELCDAIVRATGQLVLVVAPAGFGKTTLMAQAREQLENSGIPTVWLTLDHADNDMSRFMRCVVEVVRRLAMADSTGDDAFNSLMHAVSPFAIFLDEFEALHEPTVLGLVRELAGHLPRGGQLVIGSRNLPQLSLARLRARGHLIEIDASQLRFTLQDAETFFRQRRRPLTLTANQLFRLYQKTEGWVAALWLASMALARAEDQNQFIDRFSGSDRSIADYLAEDVLLQQPPLIREFLLRTSVLRQLNVSVCTALNRGVDAAALLQQLDAEQLFITPVAAETPTWRYHSLFSDYLRARLENEHPNEIARLHLAASGWYEAQGRPVPAIDHSIEGGDYPHAMELLEMNGDHFLAEGRMRLLARWFTGLPLGQMKERPRLETLSIWATCFTRGPWEAMGILERSGIESSKDPYLDAHANSLRPLLLTMQDENEEALEIGRQALQRLPTGYDFPDTTLLNAMAHITSVAGEPLEAQDLLSKARQQHSTSSTFNRMYSEANEGLIDLLHGRLRHATARFRLAVDATHASNFQHTHGNAWAGVFYASVVYESNNIDQAEHLLNVYLPLARDVGLPDHMIQSHAMLARISFIKGEVDAAMNTLTELEYLGSQRKLPRVVAAAKLERARLLLHQGNAAGAQDELLRASDPTVWSRERRQRLLAHDVQYLALAQIRWHVSSGEPASCLPQLDVEIEFATAASRRRRLLVLRLLKALALHRSGETPQAMSEVAAAVHFAAHEGFMRLVLDEGAAVGAMLHRFQSVHEDKPSRDPIVSDYLQRLAQAFGPAPNEIERSARGMAEPLTRKELRALQLLSEGYSNDAMAEKLFVSESTVRTHLRNINAKLGAHSRTQAVSIARKLGLIS